MYYKTEKEVSRKLDHSYYTSRKLKLHKIEGEKRDTDRDR